MAKIKKKPSPSIKSGTGARVDIGMVGQRGIPNELWQEARILAVINKTTVGHVVALALMDYLKKLNGAKRGAAK